jgi:hypothetical protein
MHDDPAGEVIFPLPWSWDPAGVDPSGFGVGAAVGRHSRVSIYEVKP